MDSEDTNRILDQMWEADPKLFIDWIKANQKKILGHLAEDNIVKKISETSER